MAGTHMLRQPIGRTPRPELVEGRGLTESCQREQAVCYHAFVVAFDPPLVNSEDFPHAYTAR
jgi:hypothetical protein